MNNKRNIAKLSSLHIVALTSSLLLASCADDTSPSRSTAEPVESSAAAKSATPASDFYQWANHEWLATTTIPADQPGVTNFLAIREQVNDQIEDILVSMTHAKSLSADEKKLVNIHAAYMDMDKRNALGLSPLSVELEQIDAAKSEEDIAVLFSRLQRIGVKSPMVYYVMEDLKKSDQYIVYISQSGLGLERDNYFNDDERSVKIRDEYLRLMARLFSLAVDGHAATDSAKDPEEMAASVLALEAKLAEAQWSKAENRQLDRAYNITPYATLKDQANNLYMAKQLAALGMPDDYPFNVMQPDYFSALNGLVKAEPVDAWKSYLKLRVLMSFGKLLDEKTKSALVDFEISRGMYQQEEPLERQAISYLNDNVDMLMGKVYIRQSFDDDVKVALEEVVANISNEYRLAIEASTRMSPKTKQKALEKLNAMTFKIGYPDEWRDYSEFKPVEGELAENHKKLMRFEQQRNIARLGQPVDLNDWAFAPQKVNAFYSQTKNSFVLLAGILNPPFYSDDATEAQLYGGIGFVIGHEIGHAFDDQGAGFDANGNLVNWWEPEDAAAFDRIKQALIDQANAYEILPGTRLRGELEIGEIIGDKSGSEIALRAYAKIVDRKGLDSGSSYQDFFKQLAITWRAKIRPDFQLLLLESDAHPPSEFRANGMVKHFDEFYQVFDVMPDDPMYAPPESRVHMW